MDKSMTSDKRGESGVNIFDLEESKTDEAMQRSMMGKSQTFHRAKGEDREVVVFDARTKFEALFAEEDYFEPIKKYPTLIIQHDLFMGHGGNVGLKFRDTTDPALARSSDPLVAETYNAVIVEDFLDPVCVRWGWRKVSFWCFG